MTDQLNLRDCTVLLLDEAMTERLHGKPDHRHAKNGLYRSALYEAVDQLDVVTSDADYGALMDCLDALAEDDIIPGHRPRKRIGLTEQGQSYATNLRAELPEPTLDAIATVAADE